MQPLFIRERALQNSGTLKEEEEKIVVVASPGELVPAVGSGCESMESQEGPD